MVIVFSLISKKRNARKRKEFMIVWLDFQWKYLKWKKKKKNVGPKEADPGLEFELQIEPKIVFIEANNTFQ